VGKTKKLHEMTIEELFTEAASGLARVEAETQMLRQVITVMAAKYGYQKRERPGGHLEAVPRAQAQTSGFGELTRPEAAPGIFFLNESHPTHVSKAQVRREQREARKKKREMK
jgi:hypothetical protein